jgi:hypothetical protein
MSAERQQAAKAATGKQQSKKHSWSAVFGCKNDRPKPVVVIFSIFVYI